MPKAFPAPDSHGGDRDVCIVSRNGVERQANILERHGEEVYVHYVNTDKRLDEWVAERDVRPAGGHEAEVAANGHSNGATRKRKRGSTDGQSSRRGSLVQANGDAATGSEHPEDQDANRADTSTITEEEYDIEHHKQITAKRNFDKVIFGKWQIRTWYFSPYPLTESEAEDAGVPNAQAPPAPGRIPGVARSSIRSHGRTSDLFAGGLGRSHGVGQNSTLWVCDRCFKYMAEGQAWELHVRKCTRRSPPGRKVYQRGAHIIWEVDGAKEKLYCQNLSLFGKLFIDIKTLFFDCDNFLFYILTDADSQRDHVLGFFSKEKVSYDDYNLACIVVLPPYQKKGYGMLLIEFSYELSRRAGKVGTPERPLSDLGLRSYLTYWVSTLVRFFRRLLSVLPPDTAQVTTTGLTTDISDAIALSPSRDTEDGSSISKKRRKSTKGWDGEEIPASAIAHRTAQLNDTNDPMWTSLRSIETTANLDGSATTHVVVRCTLADIARATNLRIEDAAFALNECGLLGRRLRKDSSGETEEVMAITREMVEAVAKERNIKRMCMDLAHVLL
ncbi:acyl-CoA N-acyltransferase [Lentinus tigrinus ALCF2SS1-6]|uniref:histone acetyltransferase n=1 Tax=Lentinus tigrinus ALCF2SS1-6 TaxID=1328759 RepID=A0A5C2S8H2_9APHY|nr:acyl-CoA N-acyltransferase [Lentinus tigrinus ALCF2SS1-6]